MAGAGWISDRDERPVLLFQEAEPLEVEKPGRPPQSFVWKRDTYHVEAASGPERYTPEWWQDRDLRTRDYWRVQTEEGPRFWLLTYPGAKPASWYLAGCFA